MADSMTAGVQQSSGISSEIIGQKKAQVTDRLHKRDEQRLADLEKRKQDKENTNAANENADFFAGTFSQGCTEIEDGLKTCDSLGKAELTDRLDSLALILQKLNKFLNESTMFLPSYEVQKSQETLNGLQISIQEKKEELAPKKKFAFKSKKRVAEKPAQEKEQFKKTEMKIEMSEKRFSDLKGQSLKMVSKDIDYSDIALTRLEDCIVHLFGTPSTIHATNMKNCTIFSGPISSSLFVDGCTRCTFVTACQQARVHTTTDTKFYIHVTSRAIIEDCSRLEFAPFGWSYDGLDEDYLKSGLDKTRNTWNDVDDFNWLASDAHSPNWDIIPEEQRITEWNSYLLKTK